jgi:hypothetical protein
LGAPIDAILPFDGGIFVLAANRAFGLNVGAKILWSRENVLGIGVTSALGREHRGVLPVLLTSGQVEWLDLDGKTMTAMPSAQPVAADLVREFAATQRCAWISFESGVARESCMGRAPRSFELSHSSLLRPVVDVVGLRVMFASVTGGLWSLPFSPGP